MLLGTKWKVPRELATHEQNGIGTHSWAFGLLRNGVRRAKKWGAPRAKRAAHPIFGFAETD